VSTTFLNFLFTDIFPNNNSAGLLDTVTNGITYNSKFLINPLDIQKISMNLKTTHAFVQFSTLQSMISFIIQKYLL